MLPPSFFDALSDRLELAVYDTNAEHRMTLADLKADLGDVPGLDTLSVRYGDGLQFVTYNGRTTALSESASIDEIRRALNLAKIDSFIEPVAFMPMAFADMAQIQETSENPMSATSNPMDRLTAKLAKAAGVGGRVAAKIEAKADALLEREGQLEAKTEQAFAPHEAMADPAHAHLDEVEAALNILSNGGPALDEPSK
jgi:hypothetical protein